MTEAGHGNCEGCGRRLDIVDWIVRSDPRTCRDCSDPDPEAVEPLTR